MRHSEKKFKLNYQKNKGSFKIPIITLYLPRPGNIPEPLKKFFPKGGVYPLHFEHKIKKFVGTKNYLHVFAGSATTGIRIDIRQELKPDIVADAHHLPFKDNSFEGVVLDPPYDDRFAKEMFGTGPLKEREWLKEATRVCKPGGKIAVYHNYIMPPPSPHHQVNFSLLVVTLLRFRQFPRVLTVFYKLGKKTTKITDFCAGGGGYANG